MISTQSRIIRFWRVAPMVAAIAVFVLLCASATLGYYIDRSTRQQTINEDVVQARILAATVVAALMFDDRPAAHEYVGALRANPAIRVAAVYDGNGALFADHPQDTAPPALPAGGELRPAIIDNVARISVPVLQGASRVGTVYLEAALEPVSQRIERYAVIGLLAGMSSVVVAGLGLAQKALRRANDALESRGHELASVNLNLLTEIEQREQAESALRQAQKMEAIGRLTGGVAHDFNNLLQVMLSSLERLRTHVRVVPESEAEFRRSTALASRGVERAAALTQQLLSFSRLQPLMPRPLQINQLVAGMSELLTRTLGEHIRVDTVLPRGLWRVSADQNQLEIALLNLAVNARDAMGPSGRLVIETANVTLDTNFARADQDVRPGDYVMIVVKDNGVGMSDEVRAKAIEPFFTTKDLGKGTGLGLSMVYGFTKQSGGHLRIDSTAGVGTSIQLYLPRLAPDEAAFEPSEVLDAAPTGGTETILVVEDEADVRTLTVGTLRALGYRVLEADHAASALAILQRQLPIDLLLTDVGLPGGVNGRQLAERARALRPSLRVIYVTGYERNTFLHGGRVDPGITLISKPFTGGAVARQVRDALDRPARATA